MTEFLQNLTPLVDLARILTGFGLIAVLLAFLKRNGERRCWRKFKAGVDDWIDDLRSGDRHPNEIEGDEWKAKCEELLTDARFSPLEIHQILATSVIVAQGRVAGAFFP